jgi:hypothetical protein
MPSPEPALPTTRERECPRCGSASIEPVGRISAHEGQVYVEHRCETCGIVFLFVRKPIG